MFAVIVDKAIVYLGVDRNKAVEILNSKAAEEEASLIDVQTLDELAFALYEMQNRTQKDISDAVQKLFQMLDEAGVNEHTVAEVTEVLKERGSAAISEVRHLGIQGMAAVGEGFVAIGDLLKKASQPED
jgi:hypothetical protein